MLFEYGLAGLAPDAPKNRSCEQSILLSGEQEVAGLKSVTLRKLAQNHDERRVGRHRIVRPPTAHLRLGRVSKKLTPASLRQHRVGDAEGDGLLRAEARVIERGEACAEPVAGTGTSAALGAAASLCPWATG
ncbi:hypothetical protein [Streptomyces sp. NPDC006459]|uniref:hypothetical protein n=1 Tax=Streptomyces sp. NPDC006459 TaxID=3154303 RepID=UPI0033AD1C0B